MTESTASVDWPLGGRYRLLERIGRGAVADVWRARDERLERDVAVKVFRGDAAEELGNAQAEIRTLARLDHPGLVGIYDAGTEGDRAWVVMQLIEGQPLGARVSRGPLPVPEVTRLGAELAEALAYVHEQGFVHRDVKPGNVLLSGDGRALLADFGIARIVDDTAAGRTAPGRLVGTPAYFSPEQVSGRVVGPPSDVYALGLVLLECLTGRREFTGGGLETAMARLSRDPEVPSWLPPGWRSLLTQMLLRDPDNRPRAEDVGRRLRRMQAADPDATELLSAPTELVASAGTDTRVLPPITAPPAPAPAPTRRGLGWPAIVLIAFLVAVIAAAIAVAVIEHQRTTTGSFVRTGPILHGKWERDLQRLERAIHP
jgi:serine/threonine protein kinase